MLLFLEPFLTPIILIFIALVLILGVFTIRSIYTKEKEFEKKREGEFADYEKVLNTAHDKAEHIIQEAVQQASSIKREEDEFAKHANETLDTTLKTVEEKSIASITNTEQTFGAEYQKTLETIKTKYAHDLEGMIAKIAQDTQTDFDQLHQKIRQQTIEAQSGFSKQLQDEFSKTQVEIHEYKKQRLQEVTQKMDRLVIKVAEEVLGQTIPLAQHQDLITKALERAQQEGMFDT